MLGISRGTGTWLGVVALAACALVWQGYGDGGLGDTDDGVAAVAAMATVTPVSQYPRLSTAKAVAAAGDAVALKFAADSQELLTETSVSAEENSSKLDEKAIDKMLTNTSYMPDQGFVSLDERILRSTVIARATMRSVSAYAREGSCEYEECFFPMIRFTFDVHEYLKGNGDDAITASISVECTRFDWWECGPPKQEAIDDANEWISRETNRWWENRESIIFLKEGELNNPEASGQSALPSYKFLPWIGTYATTNLYPYSDTDGFSVLSERNRVWLPASTAVLGAPWASESWFMLGNRPKDWELLQRGETGSSSFATDISLSDLKSRIKAVADLVKQGEGAERYEECLRVKLWLNRIPWTPYSLEFPFQSGLRAGSIVVSTYTSGEEYGIYFFTGDDKNFFEIVLKDTDSDPYNTYYRIVKTARPLVAGDYSVRYHQNSGILRHCVESPLEEYKDDPTANWTIRATAPAGTLHEAFFDPIAIGAGVGAGSDNGVLTPAAFSAEGSADAEIRGVDWDADVVKIEIANSPASLANHHIDFIALDGAIALRLDFDDAGVADDGVVRTFSWGVCGGPWQAGDKLMLRISESPPDLAGATSRTSCSNATPTPSATPMPTPTSQCSNSIAVPNPASNPGLVADCATLLAAKDTLEGDSGNLNWSADVGISDWEGVSIDNDGVATLELSEYRLNGAIPPEFGSLANLWILDLNGNQLTGAIPPELSNLADLSIVRLGGNQLAGAIPTWLGSLVNIWSLDLGGNQLTGGIPSRLGNLFNLEDLDLSGNQLTGEIPPELGNLFNLSELYLDSNRLTGEIPPELGDNPFPYLYLSGLTLSNNQFTGCIPDSLFSALNHRGEVDLFGSTSIWGQPFCDTPPATPTPSPTMTPTPEGGAAGQ